MVTILNDTSKATDRVFAIINFITTQDIEIKIAGKIERFITPVLNATLCQLTFIKKRQGHLDTPPHFQKSQNHV